MVLARQAFVLAQKDFVIVGARSWLTTVLRAIVLPIAYMFFIAYVRNFFLPPSDYGIGSPRPIRDLATDVFNSSTPLGGRNRVAFINNGFVGGQIEQLIASISGRLIQTGADVRILSTEEELYEICPSSLRGISPCYAAASFHASPTEGQGGLWNYTARADFGLGFSVFVNEPDNDAQIFVLPFIHAIDAEIASQAGVSLPDLILEYPFTYETIEDRQNDIQLFYMRALVNYLAVTLFIGMCGVTYHLPGYVAAERESGMSQLIDAMFLCNNKWSALVGRLVSAYMAFSTIYVAGWISMGAIVSQLIFYQTSNSVIILFHILTGLSLTSWALLGGTLFRRAQLSGITVLLTSLILAVLAQFVPRSTTTLTALSVLFPPITYTTFMIQLAEWERQFEPANLSSAPSSGTSVNVSGYLFFVFLAVQAIAFTILAAILQQALYGSILRAQQRLGVESKFAFRLNNISKRFSGSFLARLLGKGTVVKAVENLQFDGQKGEVLVLLGANGSGKSTTLKCLTGVESISEGSIELGSISRVGFCPQNNVLWNELTAVEHVKIFNGLKAQNMSNAEGQIKALLAACDLVSKTNAKSKTLSGGQKRKLQLAMAFIGGSTLCCVDEVSSGLDPLSRRKIWDILLAERGIRTLVLTTHALDEADALADRIVLMSKGRLIAQGSSVELKSLHGGGHRVTVPRRSLNDQSQTRLSSTRDGTRAIFELPNSSKACEFVGSLQRQGIQDINVSGPSVEDVFLNLAKEYEEELSHFQDNRSMVIDSSKTYFQATTGPSGSLDSIQKGSLQIDDAQETPFISQVFILIWKRVLILKRNYLPYCCALLVPAITAGLTTLFLGGFDELVCSLGALANNPQRMNIPVLEVYWGVEVPVGPSNRFFANNIPETYLPFVPYLRLQNTLTDFQQYVANNFRTVVPGGFFLDDTTSTPLLTYRINGNIGYSAIAKNILDSYLLNTTIVADFSTFALPFVGSTGNSLQLVLYFGFAMSAYPAFFALYPTFERLGNIRSLHYCNGVRPASLWLAYLIFDSVFILIVSVVTIVLFISLSSVWFAPGYLFVVFFLYGISSTLLTYIVSLFSKTQLAAFAFVAGGQAVFLLIYFIMYMVLITFTQQDQLYYNLNVVQFTYGLLTPSGNLLRALLLALNQSQLLCRDQSFITYPAEITIYGGPILYLVLQSTVFYAFLVWHDSSQLGPIRIWQPRFTPAPDAEKEGSTAVLDPLLAKEVYDTEHTTAELQVLHLTKRFGKNVCIDDLTFSVPSGNVFALLGPNGAGKSTTISLIRGDIHPSTSESDILVKQHSMRHDQLAARKVLGVCPQFDTMDRLTVEEHLAFYARIRGVPSPKLSVDRVIDVVGLSAYRGRMTANLSGGNQRKLSLGTAIVGNPSVLLLDEPSSGMDAVSKRIMWKVIESIKNGRSVLITTHSMEEATRLADKSGILAKRLLAVGSTNALTEQHGRGKYHIHLVLKDGANMQTVHDWMVGNVEGVLLDGQMLHGQLKFVVPFPGSGSSAVQELVFMLRMLEDHKTFLGIEYYSVSPTTLEDVFLNIARRAQMEEDS